MTREIEVETERATHIRQVNMENLSYRNRRSQEPSEPVTSLVDVAISLDIADGDAISAHGGSGDGAVAFLEAIVCTEDGRGCWNEDSDDEPGEHVTSIDDPLFAHLPPGDAKVLRQFIAGQKRSEVWDGNNHVTAPHYHAELLLHRIRGR